MKTLIACLVVILMAGCVVDKNETMVQEPHVIASDQIQAGRYLVTIGMCNDCHTEGYMEKEGNIAEEDWLTGSVVGWQGPWGTTYPVNLRLRAQELTEDLWVEQLRTRKVRPPMPWMNVNKMSDQDARAIYAYLKYMGPKGQHAPIALGPGDLPQTPYLNLVPQNLPVAEAGSMSN